jgi:CRP-like cAMP-binding protein
MDVKDRVRHWRMRRNHTACILDDVDLFSECTVKQLRAVAQLICPIVVNHGRVLVHAGEKCNQLVLVLSGEARTSNPTGGKRSLGAGSLFGAASVLPGSNEIETVTATTAMDLLVASRAEVSKIIRIAPSVERKLLARLADQLQPMQREAVGATRPAAAPSRVVPSGYGDIPARQPSVSSASA